MLEVESVRVDVSRVGRVLDDVTISAEPGVTVVTGRSGCGSTTLLRLIAGFHDRQVVRRQGVIRLSGRRIDTMSHAELRPQVAVVGHRPTGAMGCGDAERDRVIEELGLRDWCDRPAARMPACVAARMALAEGISSGAPVLLLDQLLAPMTSKWRPRVAACVVQVARTGRIVLWAEHALDYALGAADSVVEIIDGHARQVEASSWSSTNLPSTPLQEIAARAGEGIFASPEQAHARLAATALTAVPSPQPQQPKGPVLARVDPAALRLSGGLIDVRAGQVLGIVAHEPVQAHRAARRLAATVRPRGVNDHLLHALLRQTSVQRACGMVDRRADRPIGESMELANEVLGRLVPAEVPNTAKGSNVYSPTCWLAQAAKSCCGSIRAGRLTPPAATTWCRRCADGAQASSWRAATSTWWPDGATGSSSLMSTRL